MVFFDWDSARITRHAATTLGYVVTVYSLLPDCWIAITAHADRSGRSAYNIALSRRRVNAIISYLQRRGLRSHFRIEALGESRPLVDTDDGARERQNRRAEILVEPPPTPSGW
jgi:OOP family OmpA-OmpF porin